MLNVFVSILEFYIYVLIFLLIFFLSNLYYKILLYKRYGSYWMMVKLNFRGNIVKGKFDRLK